MLCLLEYIFIDKVIINLLNLLFPDICLACGTFLSDNELHVCTFCRNELPVTNFHQDKDNTVAKRLYGRVDFVNATSLFWFAKKSIVQRLLHNLKYRGHEEIGTMLGKWLGAELIEHEAYKDIDVVIPVPLHRSRLRQRGYNQVDAFGREIANILGSEYSSTTLVKTKSTVSQVFKDRIKRLLTHEADFSVTEFETLKGKHILLVDDIITTGATIEACANELMKIEGVRISIATMAITE